MYKKNRASKPAVAVIMTLMLASLVALILGQKIPGLALPIFSLTGICIALVVYFIPTLVAADRYRPDVASIAAINLLIGWLLVPWAFALAWALRPISAGTPETILQAHVPPMPPAPNESCTRLCPFCAETIQMAAIKCKHCGSDLIANPRDMLGK